MCSRNVRDSIGHTNEDARPMESTTIMRKDGGEEGREDAVERGRIGEAMQGTIAVA